jgi:hypothetical protein
MARTTREPPLWALASACQVHARPAQIWMIGPAVGTPGNLGSPPDPCIRRYGRHAVAKVTRLCSAELVISGGECPVRCVLRGTVQRVEFLSEHGLSGTISRGPAAGLPAGCVAVPAPRGGKPDTVHEHDLRAVGGKFFLQFRG